MSLTVSQMITEVRSLLDDYSNDASARWTDTQILRAINYSRQLVAIALADSGYAGIISETIVNPTSGVATLPAHERILSVQFKTGTTYVSIPRANTQSSKSLSSSTGDFSVRYVAKTTALSNDDPSPTVTYAGKDVNEMIVDQYCAALAAYNCKVTEGENSTVLSNQIQMLQTAISRMAKPQVQMLRPSSSSRHLVSSVDYKWSVNTSGNLEISV